MAFRKVYGTETIYSVPFFTTIEVGIEFEIKTKPIKEGDPQGYWVRTADKEAWVRAAVARLAGDRPTPAHGFTSHR